MVGALAERLQIRDHPHFGQWFGDEAREMDIASEEGVERIHKRDFSLPRDKPREEPRLERRMGMDNVNFWNLPDNGDGQTKLWVPARKRGETKNVGILIHMAGVAGRKNVDFVA